MGRTSPTILGREAEEAWVHVGSVTIWADKNLLACVGWVGTRLMTPRQAITVFLQKKEDKQSLSKKITAITLKKIML
jgi:hypothetical protein